MPGEKWAKGGESSRRGSGSDDTVAAVVAFVLAAEEKEEGEETGRKQRGVGLAPPFRSCAFAPRLGCRSLLRSRSSLFFLPPPLPGNFKTPFQREGQKVILLLGDIHIGASVTRVPSLTRPRPAKPTRTMRLEKTAMID